MVADSHARFPPIWKKGADFELTAPHQRWCESVEPHFLPFFQKSGSFEKLAGALDLASALRVLFARMPNDPSNQVGLSIGSILFFQRIEIDEHVRGRRRHFSEVPVEVVAAFQRIDETVVGDADAV